MSAGPILPHTHQQQGADGNGVGVGVSTILLLVVFVLVLLVLFHTRRIPVLRMILFLVDSYWEVGGGGCVGGTTMKRALSCTLEELRSSYFVLSPPCDFEDPARWGRKGGLKRGIDFFDVIGNS